MSIRKESLSFLQNTKPVSIDQKLEQLLRDTIEHIKSHENEADLTFTE